MNSAPDGDMPEEKEDTEFVPDEDGVAPDAEAKVRKLRERILSCEKECRQYLDGWQRAKADLINYKKDDSRRLEDMMQYASAKFLEDIVPVLDSFDMAMAGIPDKEVVRGVLLIYSQLAEVIKRRGVEEIVPAVGDVFNPAQHESIGETASDVLAGAIAEVAQKGYALVGRVIRPARVRLSKGRDGL